MSLDQLLYNPPRRDKHTRTACHKTVNYKLLFCTESLGRNNIDRPIFCLLIPDEQKYYLLPSITYSPDMEFILSILKPKLFVRLFMHDLDLNLYTELIIRYFHIFKRFFKYLNFILLDQ